MTLHQVCIHHRRRRRRPRRHLQHMVMNICAIIIMRNKWMDYLSEPSQTTPFRGNTKLKAPKW